MEKSVDRAGVRYVRIDPLDVDFTGAAAIQKLTDIYAVEVTGPGREVVTRLHEHIETVNTARQGDWIIFNIGSVKPSSIAGYAALSEDERILARARLAEAYVLRPQAVATALSVVRPVGEGVLAKASSAPRTAASVPFDFVIAAPWGEDQFVRAGGVVVNNGPGDVYGVERGAVENTYGLPGATRPFAETHASQIAAGLPLVPPLLPRSAGTRHSRPPRKAAGR